MPRRHAAAYDDALGLAPVVPSQVGLDHLGEAIAERDRDVPNRALLGGRALLEQMVDRAFREVLADLQMDLAAVLVEQLDEGAAADAVAEKASFLFGVRQLRAVSADTDLRARFGAHPVGAWHRR